ncbi:hypothetical protein [Crateriforma conspicua]|uniref:Uncharacterized protein n=1 Tax=Crateriforma conspicua TaxID=2527996 RepID=A0A5C6FIP8_9PLAN|nr:hypothetical protein [Crateriforma conspicua]TWU59531.1 hypothetical protein V7x_55770 [Crateriforma conspicua]
MAWLSVSETVCDPIGIPPLVKNRHNQDNIRSNLVIDREGKAARRHTMKAVTHRMDTTKDSKRANVGGEGFKEVVAGLTIMCIVEGNAIHKVMFCVI